MIGLSQIITLFILGPVFFPVFFLCPFRLPYLYCFICPVRCVWYRIRGLVLLMALGLNIRGGLFCNHICPFGTIQVLLSKISPKEISLPQFFRSFKYISVILILFVVLVTGLSQSVAHRFTGLSLSQTLVVKLKNLLLGIFLLSMIASIFSYRAFCYNLCPISALSRISHKIKPK